MSEIDWSRYPFIAESELGCLRIYLYNVRIAMPKKTAKINTNPTMTPSEEFIGPYFSSGRRRAHRPACRYARSVYASSQLSTDFIFATCASR